MGSIFWCSVSVLMNRVTKVTGQLFRFASMGQNNNNNNTSNNNNNYAGQIMPVTLTMERSFQICIFFDQSENTLSACEALIPVSSLRPFSR